MNEPVSGDEIVYYGSDSHIKFFDFFDRELVEPGGTKAIMPNGEEFAVIRLSISLSDKYPIAIVSSKKIIIVMMKDQ